MKLVDSRKEQLDYGHILHTYHSNSPGDGPTKDFKIWMVATAAAIAKMNAEGAIIGNTFFLYKRGSGKNSNKAMVWAMNADTLQNMADNVAEGLTRLVNMGVTEVVAIYKSPVVTRVLRQAFKKIKSDGDNMQVAKTAKNLNIVQMTLEGDGDV